MRRYVTAVTYARLRRGMVRKIGDGRVLHVFATFPAKSTLGNSRSTVDEQAVAVGIRPAIRLVRTVYPGAKNHLQPVWTHRSALLHFGHRNGGSAAPCLSTGFDVATFPSAVQRNSPFSPSQTLKIWAPQRATGR